MNYCAIIGDIVGSRHIKNRQELQDQFKDILHHVNKRFEAEIASNFTVTLGDEFQGLLFKPSICFEIIHYIKEKMHPVELVFGIGIGSMETSFSKTSSVGSDGPAYWYAREMVEKAKKKQPSICLFSNQPEDQLINSNLLLIESCTSSQTKKQKEVIKLYKEYKSQYKVAEILQISQSAVSGMLQKANYKQIDHSLKGIKTFLEHKWE